MPSSATSEQDSLQCNTESSKAEHYSVQVKSKDKPVNKKKTNKSGNHNCSGLTLLRGSPPHYSAPSEEKNHSTSAQLRVSSIIPAEKDSVYQCDKHITFNCRLYIDPDSYEKYFYIWPGCYFKSMHSTSRYSVLGRGDFSSFQKKS